VDGEFIPQSCGTWSDLQVESARRKLSNLMSDLAQYLNQDFENTSARIVQVEDLLRQLGRMFVQSRRSKRNDWPYSWDPTDTHDQQHQFPPNDKGGREVISLSTQAMCCVAVCSLLEADNDYSLLSQDENGLRTDLERILKETFGTVLERLKTPTWESSTYGPDDVFTASWLLLLYNKSKKNLSSYEWPVDFKKRAVEIVTEAITEKKTGQPQVDTTLFLQQRNEAGPHAFPLLKIVKSLTIASAADLHEFWPTSCPPFNTLLAAAGKWFEKNLHRQMSFYQFLDFRFDAAEMIFCLAGALETGVIDKRDPIVPHVFRIVQQAQERSVYWRPYRPMLHACRKRANQPDFYGDVQNVPYTRISNDRCAKNATLEDRLTLADRQMLHEMGILL
jgi:hypothetical protein